MLRNKSFNMLIRPVCRAYRAWHISLFSKNEGRRDLASVFLWSWLSEWWEWEQERSFWHGD
jgi:hypothetical protein